jgi:hypothetical protein
VTRRTSGRRCARPWRDLNKAVNEILADPKAKARFAELGAFLLPGSASDFGKLLADEGKWGKVVRFAGAKVD